MAREDLGRLLLRVALGAVVLLHGIFKLRQGVAWMARPLGELGLPGFLAYGSYLAEVVAPVLVILGVLARPAALLIAFQMLMAVLLVLRGQVLALKPSGGGWAIELEFLIAAAALALALLGSGRYRLGRTRWD
jgi:putative oxidoreductase